MPEEKSVICVTCPMGCVLSARVADGDVSEVSGQACKRGVDFVREEVLAPRRMLTTSVTVRGGELPLVAVRSRIPLPKSLLLPAAARLRQVEVRAPVHQGQLILANILESGIDIIASRDIAASAEPGKAC